MDRRTLAAVGLAMGGLSQLGYGALLGPTTFLGAVSLAEGGGLLLAAIAVARVASLPGAWFVGGLTLAAVAALPWFPQSAGFDGVGPIASLLNNTGSVVAALGVLAWTLAFAAPHLGATVVRAGFGLQALGSAVRLPGSTAPPEWLVAFTLAFVGFAVATYAFAPVEAAGTVRPAEEAVAATGKAR